VFESEDGGDNPVGTGPFRFVSWTRDSSLVVEKNPNYWRANYPLLDQIEFRVITDGGARASAVLSGDLDAMETSEADTVKAFFERAERGEYQIYFADEGDTDEAFVMFNTTKQPFDDPVLRKAAIQAIDTEAVNDQVYDKQFVPARGPIAPSSEWYFETDYPDFDPAAAKQAIEAWEAANGRGMSFEANVPPDPAVLKIAQLMKDLASDVGVEVELNTMEQTRLILDAITGDYESTGFAQIFNVAHPDGMYAFLHSSSIPDDPLSNDTSLNFPRYANAKIDAALDGARATDDPEEQREFYNELQQALAEDTPYLWLVHVKAALVARNNVRSLTTWELPDGTPGKPQFGTRVPFFQVWVE
jgi:peptide/nickel transport system substrate-binding protein